MYVVGFQVLGDRGMLEIKNKRITFLEHSDAYGTHLDRTDEYFLSRYSQAYRNEIDHFLDVIQGTLFNIASALEQLLVGTTDQ